MLLNPAVRTFAMTCGTHPFEGTLCVMEFAHDFALYTSIGANLASRYFDLSSVGFVEVLSLARKNPQWLLELVQQDE